MIATDDLKVRLERLLKAGLRRVEHLLAKCDKTGQQPVYFNTNDYRMVCRHPKGEPARLLIAKLMNSKTVTLDTLREIFRVIGELLF
jgi:hypothetical protein